ncbi:MAG: hypothetical protein WC966_03355 [Bradymonadales bacterium]|jgi:hypothetical protein
MKKQILVVAALFALVFSTQAFAQSSLSDSVDEISTQALIFEDVSTLLGSDSVLGTVVIQGGGSVHVGHGSQTRVRRTTYRRNYRPRHYGYGYGYGVVAAPVVVSAAPVVESTTVASSTSQSGYGAAGRISVGVRILGLSERKTNVDKICFDDPVYGGVGLYLRIRPLRYIGVELASDILISEENSISTFKVPLTVGVMGHLFDYGIFDLYAIGAGGIIFNTVNYGSYSQFNEKFIQFTGQLGAGLGLNFGGFELFLDARYTLTQARPKLKDGNNFFYENSATNKPDDKVSHGILFHLGIGLSN